jgi:5'-nucleotidase
MPRFTLPEPLKFLIANDDGIAAPGLQALVEAAAGFGEAIVAAPAAPQSGMSHAITYDRRFQVEERGPRRFAVHGTPADCARIGLHRLAPDAAWVLSGINHGGNLGADVHYSGTIAAVREAVLHGWPGIAFSHYRHDDREYDWARAAQWTARVLGELLAQPPPTGAFYNVNLPHLRPEEPDPELVFCPLDPHPLPLSFHHDQTEGLLYNGDYQARRRTPGADVDVCFTGRISVTLMRLF